MHNILNKKVKMFISGNMCLLHVFMFISVGFSYDSLYLKAEGQEVVANVLDQKEAITSDVPDKIPLEVSAEENLMDMAIINKIIDELDVKDMDINAVFDVISQKTGISIVADETLYKNITIYLQDVDVFEALRIILDSNDLAYEIKDSIVHVIKAETFEEKFGYRFGQEVKTEIVPVNNGVPGDMLSVLNNVKSENGSVILNYDTKTFILIDKREELNKMIDIIKQMDVKVDTESFVVEYADLNEVANKVRGVLSANVGKVSIDHKNKSLVISDTRDKLDKIQTFISSLDKNYNNIMIFTKVLQITLDDDNLDGIDWNAIVSDYQVLSTNGFSHSEWDVNDKVSVGTILNEDYDVLIEALSTVGIVRNISDNQYQSLDQGAVELSVSSRELTMSQDESGIYDKNAFNEEARIYLKRYSSSEDMLSFDLAVNVVEVDQDEKTDMSGLAVVNIKPDMNETIVIGGLYKEVLVGRLSKIPILGDIPFLGFAFKKNKRNLRRTEVVIFITAKEETTVPSQ
jgi:type II secretory pathway component GspD/PulD (secretin)